MLPYCRVLKHTSSVLPYCRVFQYKPSVLPYCRIIWHTPSVLPRLNGVNNLMFEVNMWNHSFYYTIAYQNKFYCYWYLIDFIGTEMENSNPRYSAEIEYVCVWSRKCNGVCRKSHNVATPMVWSDDPAIWQQRWCVSENLIRFLKRLHVFLMLNSDKHLRYY